MFRLEMKRIFSKKINRFALVTAMILEVIFAGFAVTSNRYVKEDGTISTARPPQENLVQIKISGAEH